MRLRSLGYRTDLMLARLQGAVVTDRGDHLVIRTPDNPGFHWGNYVLAGESWLDRPLADLVVIFRAEHPGADHLAIGVDGVDGRAWGGEELAACGLEADRSVVMTARQVLEPQHPNPGAVCRMLAAGPRSGSGLGASSGPNSPSDPGADSDADPGSYVNVSSSADLSSDSDADPGSYVNVSSSADLSSDSDADPGPGSYVNVSSSADLSAGSDADTGSYVNVTPNADLSADSDANTGPDADWAAAVDLHSIDHGSFDPLEFRDFVQRRMAARREQQAAGLGGWFGAFVDAKMVSGLGLFTDGSGLGRFQDVETLAEFRRTGLAAALVHHASVVGLREFGIRDLVMVADPEYAAIRIYRSLGFTESEVQVGLARPVHGP